MFLRIKRYIKFFPGLFTLIGLLLTSSLFYKNVGKTHIESNSDDNRDKVAPQLNQDTDQNSFLFVDCTGFFE